MQALSAPGPSPENLAHHNHMLRDYIHSGSIDIQRSLDTRGPTISGLTKGQLRNFCMHVDQLLSLTEGLVPDRQDFEIMMMRDDIRSLRHECAALKQECAHLRHILRQQPSD